jgi:hypothetical protein
MKKLLQPNGNHLRYACGDHESGSKKHFVFCLKTTLLTGKRAFYLTDRFEWVLDSRVHDQFILVPFVIAIGHGLDGGQRIR